MPPNASEIETSVLLRHEFSEQTKPTALVDQPLGMQTLDSRSNASHTMPEQQSISVRHDVKTEWQAWQTTLLARPAGVMSV